MRKLSPVFFLLMWCLPMSLSHALSPLKSIILGDLTNQYVESVQDPLDYIFQVKTKEQEKNEYDLREELALYRGFLEEGVSLDNFCKAEPTIKYPSVWDKAQVTRSFLSNMQYIGLDLTSRALGKYGKYFEFTEEEYNTLVDNLVGNYCSRNISIMSLNSIRENLKIKFSKENNFQLPSVTGNALFPKKFNSMIPEEKARENEFYQTLELFKSFCSWGGDHENLRLLVPLVRNAQVMAFIIRQMSSIRLEWNEFKRGFKLENYKDTSKVLCQGLICRKASRKDLETKLPRGIGSKSIADDLKRVYCQNLRDADYKLKDQAPKIRQMIKERTFDDENLLTSHLISLITNVPDLFVRSEKFSNAKEFMRASLDSSWDQWSLKQADRFKNELLFEESMTIELVKRKFYYDPFKPKFAVIFDVNMGEYDRVFQRRGKVRTRFDIKLSKGMLAWVRKTLLNADPKKPKQKDFVYTRVEQSVVDAVELAKFKFKIPPWKKGLEKLIAREIINQVVSLFDDPYQMNETGMVSIPVEFNYGIFALKYIHSKHLVEKNQKLIEKNLKKFQQEQAQNKPSNGQK